jgi:hypothetical protein
MFLCELSQEYWEQAHVIKGAAANLRLTALRTVSEQAGVNGLFSLILEYLGKYLDGLVQPEIVRKFLASDDEEYLRKLRPSKCSCRFCALC